MPTLERTLKLETGELVLLKRNGTFFIHPRDTPHPASKTPCVDMRVNFLIDGQQHNVWIRQFNKYDLKELGNNLLRIAETL